MTPYERMIEHQHRIEFDTSRVTGLERQLAQGIRVDLPHIGVIEESIRFIWPMSSAEDRSKLEALRIRVNRIKCLNPPEPEMLPTLMALGIFSRWKLRAR